MTARHLTTPAPVADAPPVQCTVEVVGARPVDAYVELRLAAPEIAERAQPGQFVAFAVGGETSGLLLRRNGVTAEVVGKFSEGPGNVVEAILAGDVDMVVNTPFGAPGNSGPRLDGYEIRTAAVSAGIPCITTVQGLGAAVQGIEALRQGGIGVRSLQEVHAALAAGTQA